MEYLKKDNMLEIDNNETICNKDEEEIELDKSDIGDYSPETYPDQGGGIKKVTLKKKWRHVKKEGGPIEAIAPVR